MPKIDWTWLIVGMLIALFVLPFVQAQLGGRMRKNSSGNI